MIFTLPLQALSVNKAYRSGPRYKSKEYVAYEKELAYLLPRGNVLGPVKIDYTFGLKYPLRSDVSNYIKILEDCMVRCGKISDDRNVWEITARKVKSAEPFIKVCIEKKEPSEE